MPAPVAVYQITATLRDLDGEDPGPPIDKPLDPPTLKEVNDVVSDALQEVFGFAVKVTSERKDI